MSIFSGYKWFSSGLARIMAFGGLLFAPVLCAIANRVNILNPDASLFDLTLGGFYGLFTHDPNEVLAVDPSRLISPEDILTGGDALLAGGGGVLHGLGLILESGFDAALDLTAHFAVDGLTGGLGTLTSVFTSVAGSCIDNPFTSACPVPQ